MERIVTDGDWIFLQDKFGKLIKYVSWRIPRLGYLTREDKEAEISNIMLDAINKYKPEEGESEQVSDFIKTNRFASYVKTCIWHKRTYLTKQIYNKRATDGDNVSLSALSADYVESRPNFVTSHDSPLRDVELTPELKDFVDEIMSDLSNFRKGGTINISKVSRDLNISPSRTRALLGNLKTLLEEQIID